MATELTIDWGTDDVLDTTISHLQLTGSGLAGYTFAFYAKRSKTDSDASALMRKTPTITTTGSNTDDGVISTALAAADTMNLPRYTTVLFWRIVATDSNNVETVPDEGTLVVRVS